MFRDNFFSDNDYVVSIINVYPNQGQQEEARLFHPDFPDFDVSSYTAVNQQLIRNGGFKSLPISRQLDLTDNAIDTTPANGIMATCEVQSKNTTVNIPRLLLAKAGFSPGTLIKVVFISPVLKIEASNDGNDQRVDAEGRIRIHGQNVLSLNKNKGDTYQVTLVEDQNGKKYIEVK